MGSDARLVRGAAQKELVKAFESLCGRHGRWEVWADWITMSACSISCAVDAAHKEAREKLYQTTRAKYTEAELQVMAEMLGCAGYVVIGDSLAHPSTAYDRRGLIPRDEGNVWYTPMYFHTIWQWRRALAQVDMMCKASQGPEEHQNQPAPKEPPKRPCKGGKGESRKNVEDDSRRRPQLPDCSANEDGQLTRF